ncbi:MAG: hypothetical protein WHV60_08800 [Bacteroidota bacterium]
MLLSVVISHSGGPRHCEHRSCDLYSDCFLRVDVLSLFVYGTGAVMAFVGGIIIIVMSRRNTITLPVYTFAKYKTNLKYASRGKKIFAPTNCALFSTQTKASCEDWQ